MVTNVQLYIALGIPLVINAGLIGLMMAYMNANLEGLETRFEARFEMIDRRFQAIEQRLDNLRDLWRAGLRRVEEVLDARLKHLESRR